jgi:hypothetical protein
MKTYKGSRSYPKSNSLNIYLGKNYFNNNREEENVTSNMLRGPKNVYTNQRTKYVLK